MFGCFYRPDQRPQSMHTEDTEITHSHGKLELITTINDVTSRQLNRPNRNKTTFNVHSDQKDNTFAQKSNVNWSIELIGRAVLKNHFVKIISRNICTAILMLTKNRIKGPFVQTLKSQLHRVLHDQNQSYCVINEKRRSCMVNQ